MNAKPAPARYAAASGFLAVAALACAAGAEQAAAQFYGPQYGRSSPYGSPYARDQYGRPVDQYGRPIRQAPQAGREAKRTPAAPKSGAAPVLAVVSLNDQRITVYDADGRKMLQSPVSTGATSYETPVGIYSVVQKKEEHHSNQYEDGNMPFMQRITWTGIALHAGVLPGHPASHGCIRMPIAFAERLFGLTDIGLRVIVVRDDMAPGEIAHPALFKPTATRREAALAPSAANVRISAPGAESVLAPPPGSPKLMEFLKSKAAAKAAEAEAATKKATAAKQAAARKAAEAVPAGKAVKAAEADQARARDTLQKAEDAVQKAEQALAAATAAAAAAASAPVPESEVQSDAEKEKEKAEAAREKAEAAREKAAAKLAEAQAAKERAAARVAETDARLEAAKAQAQAKADAAEAAAMEARAADAAREAAMEAAEEASRQTSPVSVFISRKTQRLYIRKGYHPIHEGPVAIRDADKPLGNYVFTALNYPGEGADARWVVTSMYKASGREEQPAPAKGQRPRTEARSPDAAPSDIAGAKAALDRISIPQDTLERISEVVLPGSSLIVSDEGLSLETGKDTDFVVLMSGEPQGGIKTRRREQPRYRDDDFWGGGGGNRRGGGGGCMFLFGC
jgi:lipoprotein-anchoring transpeptidase ErfK/SrfK